MAARVIPIGRRKGWSGNKNQRHFEAKRYADTAPRKTLSSIALFPAGKKTKTECLCCERPVRRSWRTDILWDHCFTCRYLKMIYGPNIGVKWTGKKE